MDQILVLTLIQAFLLIREFLLVEKNRKKNQLYSIKINKRIFYLRREAMEIMIMKLKMKSKNLT